MAAKVLRADRIFDGEAQGSSGCVAPSFLLQELLSKPAETKGPNGELKRYEEISPFLYRQVNGQDLIGFHKNSNGLMEFSLDFPFFVFERASIADNKNLNMAIIVPSLIFIALAVLFWPVGASIRWHYGTKLDLTSSEKRLRLAVRLVCILDLVVVVGWLIFISGTNEVANLSRSRDPSLYLLQILVVIAAISTLIVILAAFRSWTKTGKWIWAKLFDVALALACLGFTWLIWHWNLINFNLRY